MSFAFTAGHIGALWAHITRSEGGRAGATGGGYVYMHVYLHRSVKWGVNHFTYMVINTHTGTKWVSKLAI